MSLVTILKQTFQNASTKAFATTVDIDISPAKENFGDYQCTSPMKLAGTLGKKPREIAECLIAQVEITGPIAKLEIAGPGFINIHIDAKWLSLHLSEIAKDARLGVPMVAIKQRVICEFSSPNIAKEMHVGHLRSTIIGDAIARLFEFLGHDVIRLNHVGDFGTQFGMLIAYLKQFHPEVLQDSTTTSLTQLMEWYKQSKVEFDSSESFKKAAHEEVPKLQAGASDSVQIWKKICAISRTAFEEIYQRLDVKLTERGESFYSPFLAQVVSDFEKRGLVTVDHGAKCIFLDGFKNSEGNPLPLIIQKSDGGYNYATTDIAGFFYRIHHDKAERIIILTDIGQSLHFKMVYDAVVKAGYLDPSKIRFDHVPFGLVLAPNKKKFKTREGNTEKLADLLDEAVEEAKNLLAERNVENIEEAAIVLGLGSVKYADLSCNRVKDYTFSYERMLRFEGNTAPFILYAYVRIQSIKRKVGKMPTEGHISLHHPTEIALGLHLSKFGDVLYMIHEDLLPHSLAEYLFHLAEKFHAFFRDCRVEGSPEESSRLILLDLTAKIIAKGLSILGIRTLDKM